ncbi:MAG: hypothetical protein ACYCSR_13725 [Thiomonas sp.]
MAAHVEHGECPWNPGLGKAEQSIQSIRSADDVSGPSLRILHPILHGQDARARAGDGSAWPQQKIGVGCQRRQRLLREPRRLAMWFGGPQDGAIGRFDVDDVKPGMPCHEAAQGLRGFGVWGRRVGVGAVQGGGSKLQFGEPGLKAIGDGVRIA